MVDSAAKMPDYLLQHDLRLIENLSILNSQDAYALLLQEGMSCCIVIVPKRIKMRLAVQLYRQLLTRTIEVDDVRADAVLAPELPAFQPALLEEGPEFSFRRSRALA